MKRLILPAALGLVCLIMVNHAYSQDLDLIVNTNGDSIACRIDSIGDTQIYFKMGLNDAWIQTHMKKSDVVHYQNNVIARKNYIFKSGTTIIESPRLATDSLHQVRKNAVYAGIMTLIYSRTIPAKRYGFTLGAGILYIDGWGLLGESTILVGKEKHYFEPGIMLYQFLTPDRDYSESGDYVISETRYSGASLRAGYRYQGLRGLVIRAAANLIYFDDDVFFWPALSLGYSF